MDQIILAISSVFGALSNSGSSGLSFVFHLLGFF
ncbi:hypothetical protein CIP107507_00242 [Corynebacterium diphtheriae]|uniref:Uncharacterized protein n=1 Tax=Corynebacterium diphtheriae TaxID=1717 RepID=A0A811G4U2_CORDP|nr:hypothetical protein CIP107507_00242 [Corynebacterium diphtheriae]CAB0490176.1 hypothetical protein CIP107505_00267 [Corynebacterium diphtheriae]CAB0491271.1 hypothetical protein CIP107502_00312 [Corynebacterium diphtheriae]CAB0536269.1 hypothetical protein CIP107523_00323 [Corynebacterium diphtheriae]CAB0538384.1 hypothetical protein CIP107529_00450 [Corynebacterium diphtheriae]